MGEAGTPELFRGVGVALVTLFTDDGSIDPAGTGKLACQLVSRGIRAVLVAGTTGEAGTLTDIERRALVEAVREAIPGDVPVIAGTGAPSVRQATALTRDAVCAGADAVLTWPPSGSKDLAGYYAAVAEAAGGRPVLAYHYEVVSRPGVPVSELPGLPVAGIKDSSGSANRLLEELTHYRGAVYVGSSGLLAMAGPMGAAGALLALANLEPERCVTAFTGDAETQLALARPHLLARDEGIPGLKRVLSETQGLSPVVRLG
jgi:4-hydroxy-tetrahydrodipicolinate synthase